jgi:hypothetical protein
MRSPERLDHVPHGGERSLVAHRLLIIAQLPRGSHLPLYTLWAVVAGPLALFYGIRLLDRGSAIAGWFLIIGGVLMVVGGFLGLVGLLGRKRPGAESGD